MKRLTLTIICIVLTSTIALGHWDPGMPAKWVQLPDIGPSPAPFPTGIDVNATAPKVLADDFLCTATGPVTEVHIWGSWRNDLVIDPAMVDFILSFHADIPASPISHSMPGELLWEGLFPAGSFHVRPYGTIAPEGWYNPNYEEYEPISDFIAWQYNFYLDPSIVEPFIQKGTPDAPIVYWLNVMAIPHDPGAMFGWKTSVDHWNDDAVWSDIFPDGTAPDGFGWRELRYPMEHPYAGESIDLAFVIVPEPITLTMLALGGLALINKRR